MGKRGRRKVKGKTSATLAQLVAQVRENTGKAWELQEVKEDFLKALNSIYGDYDCAGFEGYKSALRNWEAGLTGSGQPFLSQEVVESIEGRANDNFQLDLNNELMHIVYVNIKHYVTCLSTELLSLPLSDLLREAFAAYILLEHKAKQADSLTYRLSRTLSSSDNRSCMDWSTDFFLNMVLSDPKFVEAFEAARDDEDFEQLDLWVYSLTEQADQSEFYDDYDYEVKFLQTRLEMTKQRPVLLKPNLRSDWLESLRVALIRTKPS